MLAEAGLVEEVPELAKDRRERWWRLVSTGFRWSRAEFADDPSAVAAALSAESIRLRQQFERARDWLDNYEAAGEWDDAAFATQYWLTLTPDELRELSEELLSLLQRWQQRDGTRGRAGRGSRSCSSPAASRPSRETRLPPAVVRRGRQRPRQRHHRGAAARCSPSSASAPGRAGWAR